MEDKTREYRDPRSAYHIVRTPFHHWDRVFRHINNAYFTPYKIVINSKDYNYYIPINLLLMIMMLTRSPVTEVLSFCMISYMPFLDAALYCSSNQLDRYKVDISYKSQKKSFKTYRHFTLNSFHHTRKYFWQNSG